MSSQPCRISFPGFFMMMLLAALFIPAVAWAKFQPPMPSSPGEPENGKVGFSEPDWMVEISFIDDTGKNRKFKTRGEYWYYSTKLGDDQDAQKQAVLSWLAEKGGTVLAQGPGKILARNQEGTSDKLTYYFELSNDRTRVTVYLERMLTKDNTITMTIGGEERKSFDVWMEHDGKQYTALVVAFEKEQVSAYGTFRSDFDGYGRSMHHTHECRIEHGPRQVVFDIPQYSGAYKWRIHTDAKTAQTVSISLEQGPPLPEFVDGPGLGALRVRNLPNTTVSVEEEWEFSPTRTLPKWTTRPDRTPEGDAIFWLAPGYWQVKGAPPKESGLTSAAAHMIPVHAGKTTQVDWPRSFSTLFAPKGVGRLEIMDTRHQGDTAQVDISLVELEDNILPEADRMNCYEGGLAGKIISVEPLKSPLNVVLLLDSSGSMKGAMKQAVDAVKTFVTLFPENAEITIVDFDTKPQKLIADNRSKLLTALNTVKANGATALYDSILLGLGELKNMDRRALVVFTDGVDANFNDTGPGSKATKPEVLKAVENGKTPIYTIGFGKSPDVDTLTRVASLSGGTYYEAHDKETLDTVFTKISENLGRQYRVTYQRPQMAALSDVPVIALVVDNSGSMDYDPKRKGCGYRIQKVQEILKAFRNSLPKEFLVQLITFEDDVHFKQVISSDPAPLIRGLSLMKGYGGTNILGSTQAALDTLKAVPSTRKYLVYLTDAAMQVEKKDQAQMDICLSSLQDEGIQSLFIGMVDADEGGVFEHAAKMSDGRYVISTDLAKIQDVFAELAGTIKTTDQKEKRLSLRLTLANRDDRGKNRLFSAGRLVDFPMLPVSDQVISPEALAWSIEGPMVVYDNLAGSTVFGGDRLAKTVSVDKRIPLEVITKDETHELGVTGHNEAIEVKVAEMIFLSRLKDIDPPGRHRFLVLPMTLTNTLKSQKVAVYKDGSQHPAAWMAGSAAPERYEEKIPPYLIPDLTRHMFLTWNNEIIMPVSPASWLCEEPLLLPGERSISILPDNPVTGACAFIVPDKEMTQASLQFYDINYGHMDIPLVGVIKEKPVPPSELPTEPPKKLGDSFSLIISNVTDQDSIGQVSAGKGFVFRIIEGYLTSKVQALLSINPGERFTYHLPTDKGNFVFRLHEATEYVPMGFYRATMVTLGARNVIRMAFRMPKELADLAEKGYLFADVFGGGVHLELSDVSAPPSKLEKPGASGQGMEIYVNGSGLVKERIVDRKGILVAVDITLKDESDRSHTKLGHLVVIKKRGTGSRNEVEHYNRHHAAFTQKAISETSKGLKGFGKGGVVGEDMVRATGASLPIPMGEKYIFGMDEKSVVFDGQMRRGVMLFELPREDKIEDWEIGSWILKDASIPITNTQFNDKLIFSERLVLKDEMGDGFWRNLEKKVSELQAERVAKGYEKPGNVSAKPVDLDTADLGKQPVPVPGNSTPGAKRLKEVSSIKDIWKLISDLRWLPGHPIGWRPQYAPEAVLTQGWGDQSDLSALAENMLNRQGIVTTRIAVTPTNEGKKALAEMIHAENIKIDSLPALLFTEHGNKKLMVFPWCRDIKEIENLVTWDGEEKAPQDWPQRIRIQVRLELDPVVSQENTGNTRVAASVLAGGGSVVKRKWETLFDYTYLSQDISQDAIDIGYTEARKDGHEVIRVVVDGPEGRQIGQREVRLDQYTVINEWIGANMDNGPWRTAQQPVDSNHPITGRFHTLSLNAPDLDNKRVKELAGIRKAKYEKAEAPDGLSALKWYGRCIINRFIAAQTRFENDLAKKLDLTIGRSRNGRSILVTTQRATKEADPSTRMDLLYVANDIHGGKAGDFNKATHAFNILSGFAAARFEAAAIPGGGTGLFELWAQSPEGTQLAYIDHHNKRAFIEMLKNKEYPESLVKYFNDLGGVILFPANPAIINGEARWAWLEIDPKTYRVVSRLDNGAAGAMIESIIGNLFEQATSYLVGALVGIDVSLWSVSRYSLQLEDYEEICEKAYGFAIDFVKKFSVNEEITGPVGWDIGGSPDVELVKFDRYIKFSLDFSGVKASNNMLGFKNGYKDGVEYYFSD